MEENFFQLKILKFMTNSNSTASKATPLSTPLSNDQLQAIKGGDDTTTTNIVIEDLIIE
jgi:hypothetical protein